MIKTLIRCPQCESLGQIRTLGLMLPDGAVSIQRQFAKGGDERDFTVVLGNNFSLVCGACGATVYKRESSGTLADRWFFGVEKFALQGTFAGTL